MLAPSAPGAKRDVATTENAAGIAIAGKAVFVLRNTSNAAVVTRFDVDRPLAPTPTVPIEGARYGEVKGLAVDPGPGGCVYFTARPVAAGISTFALRSAPKATVAPASDF